MPELAPLAVAAFAHHAEREVAADPNPLASRIDRLTGGASEPILANAAPTALDLDAASLVE